MTRGDTTYRYSKKELDYIMTHTIEESMLKLGRSKGSIISAKKRCKVKRNKRTPEEIDAFVKSIISKPVSYSMGHTSNLCQSYSVIA